MNFITDVILPLALAFIMFTLGLGLTFSDFARVAKTPKNFIIGLISQLIFLPIVALIIVFVWPLQHELAIGLILIAAAPGGVTSNILTSFSNKYGPKRVRQPKAAALFWERPKGATIYLP